MALHDAAALPEHVRADVVVGDHPVEATGDQVLHHVGVALQRPHLRPGKGARKWSFGASAEFFLCGTARVSGWGARTSGRPGSRGG